MQLESKEPSHGTLASLGYTFEYFMNADPWVPAYSQRCAVYETYACAYKKAYPILFHTENKQLAKISSLTANDLETSEVPYFTSFCIKSKERL